MTILTNSDCKLALTANFQIKHVRRVAQDWLMHCDVIWSRLQDRMWRKNRGKSTTLLNLLSNCKGVDLNRNFAYSWGELDILRSQGGTPLPCLETFIGDSPFSEVSGRASN